MEEVKITPNELLKIRGDYVPIHPTLFKMAIKEGAIEKIKDDEYGAYKITDSAYQEYITNNYKGDEQGIIFK